MVYHMFILAYTILIYFIVFYAGLYRFILDLFYFSYCIYMVCVLSPFSRRKLRTTGGSDSPRSGQMTWEQFEGQLDNPVMEATKPSTTVGQVMIKPVEGLG